MKRSTLPRQERAERIITVPSDSLELAAGRRYSLLQRDGRYEIWDVRTQREVVSYTEGAGQLAWARYHELEHEAGLTGASRGAAHGAWSAIARNWEIVAVLAAVAIAAIVLFSDLRKDTLVIDTTAAATGPSDAAVARSAGLGAAASVVPGATLGTSDLAKPESKPAKKPWKPDGPEKRTKPAGNGGNGGGGASAGTSGDTSGGTGTSGGSDTSGGTGGSTSGGGGSGGGGSSSGDPPGSGNEPPSPPPDPVVE